MSQDKLVESLSKPNLKYIYVVDDEINKNVFTLMKKKESDTSISIPIKYRKYISKLLNLTNSKKNYTSKRILKIKPLELVFSRRLDNSKTINIEDGISFVTNKENYDDTYNRKKSYFGELTFGEDRGKEDLEENQKTFKFSFNPIIAANQLINNLDMIRLDTGIVGNNKIVVIVRYDNVTETILNFVELVAYEKRQPQSSLQKQALPAPPRTSSGITSGTLSTALSTAQSAPPPPTLPQRTPPQTPSRITSAPPAPLQIPPQILSSAPPAPPPPTLPHRTISETPPQRTPPQIPSRTSSGTLSSAPPAPPPPPTGKVLTRNASPSPTGNASQLNNNLNINRGNFLDQIKQKSNLTPINQRVIKQKEENKEEKTNMDMRKQLVEALKKKKQMNMK